MSNIPVKRGRKVNPDSDRQKTIVRKAAAAAAGIAPKGRGRPIKEGSKTDKKNQINELKKHIETVLEEHMIVKPKAVQLKPGSKINHGVANHIKRQFDRATNTDKHLEALDKINRVLQTLIDENKQEMKRKQGKGFVYNITKPQWDQRVKDLDKKTVLYIELWAKATDQYKEEYDRARSKRNSTTPAQQWHRMLDIENEMRWFYYRDDTMATYTGSVNMIPMGSIFNIIRHNTHEHFHNLNITASNRLLKDDAPHEYSNSNCIINEYVDAVRVKIDVIPEHAHKYVEGHRKKKVTQSGLSISNQYVLTPVMKGSKVFKDYVQESYHGWRAESCLFTAILMIYKKAIENCKMGSKRWKKTHSMTYEGLVPGQDGGACDIDTIINEFFRPFHLCLIVLNANNDLIPECCYHPDMDGHSPNTNIAPATLALIMHENHVFVCNRNLESLKHVYIYDSSVKNYVNIRKQNAIEESFGHYPQPYERPTNVKLIETIDDLCLTEEEEKSLAIAKLAKIAKKDKKTKKDNDVIANYIYNGDLMDIAIDLKNEGHSAMCSMKNSHINGINLMLGDRDISIRNHCDKHEKKVCNVPLMTLENKLDLAYNCEKYKSCYDQDTKRMFKLYAPPAINGGFVNGKHACVAVDKNKHYTSMLLQIDKMPTLSVFDRFEPLYVHEGIKDTDILLVERNSLIDHAIYWTYRERMLMLGCDYKNYTDLFEVLRVLRPSGMAHHDTSVLKEIIASDNYEINTSDNADDIELKKKQAKDNKKQACNRTIGRFGVDKMEVDRGMLFNDEDEAADFAATMEFKAGSYKKIELEYTANNLLYSDRKPADLWFVKTSMRKTELCDGFLPIWFMIRALSMREMQRTADAMRAAGVTIYGIKTDCLYCKNDDALATYKAKNAAEFTYTTYGESMGKMGVANEEEKTFRKYEEPREQTTFLPEIKYSATTTNLSDEWMADGELTDEQTSYFDENRCVFVSSKYPGSGKSSIPLAYIKKRGLKTMVVSGDNAVGRTFKKAGKTFMTLHKFFGVGLANDALKTKGYRKLASEGYQAIIFEEMAKANVEMLQKSKWFIDRSKDNYFIVGNGDPFQLLNDRNDWKSNEVSLATYKMDAIRSMFPHELFLKICKRFKDPNDRRILERIFDMLFKGDMSVREVAELFFKQVGVCEKDDVFITYSNIAAWNIRNRKNDQYKVGDVILCRDGAIGRNDIHVNEYFTIVAIADDKITLANCIDDEECEITEYALFKFFEPEGAITCHSAQGDTIDKRIVVCEYDHEMANDPRWFWTAITRATSLANVVLMSGVRAWDRSEIFKKIQTKIAGYRAQDVKAGRSLTGFIDKEYTYGAACATVE
jgi:hypothetical protein